MESPVSGVPNRRRSAPNRVFPEKHRKSRKSRKSRISGIPEGAPIDHFLRGKAVECPQKVWGPGNPILKKGLSFGIWAFSGFSVFFAIFRVFSVFSSFSRFFRFYVWYTLKMSIPAGIPHSGPRIRPFLGLRTLFFDANTPVLLYSVGSLRPTSMYTARDRRLHCISYDRLRVQLGQLKLAA